MLSSLPSFVLGVLHETNANLLQVEWFKKRKKKKVPEFRISWLKLT